MTEHIDHGPGADRQPRSGGLYFWYGMLSGIGWWAVHISGQAALVPYVCHSGQIWTLHAITAVTAVLTLIGLPAVWGAWRRREPIGEGGVVWLGQVGVYINLISVAAIILEWIPVLIIDPCLS